ncbi:MAG: chemotaxis protein CheW [candidate division WOR-3 bacterium]
MSSLLKAKQLILLLQDGFRALGDLPPTPNLINTLKTELQQLSDAINDLNLPGLKILIEKLTTLLEGIPLTELDQFSSPIYSQENVQIMLETLYLISNHLVSATEHTNINIQDLASVLDMLHQQKSAEIKLRTESQHIAMQNAPQPVIESNSFTPDAVTDTIAEKAEKSSVEICSRQEEFTSFHSAHATEPHLIFRVNGRFFAILYSEVEKVVKLSLADLKLVANEITAMLDGKQIVFYDSIPLSDSNNPLPNESEENLTKENETKETFLALILNTGKEKIGILVDEIYDFRGLKVEKFQSILGKIRGIKGVAVVDCLNKQLVSTNRWAIPQPLVVFVLAPDELYPLYQNLPSS